MSERERVAHLLRRFGLGASQRELDTYARLGVDNAIVRLVHYEGVEENFNVGPWNFAFDTSKNMVNPDTSRFVQWWAMQMLLTDRPLEQNLTLFWHNHFAVSGQKVENGPMMLQYLTTLKRHANGNFRTMLSAVFQDPAMIKWLDTDTNIKGIPNENYAREVMELFTLGVGNYTEKDIKEIARCLTGWSTRPAILNPGKVPYHQLVTENIGAERPMFVSSYSPMLHDDGFKTVFGKRGNYDSEAVFDMLVDHPAHGKFLIKKLWEWFVYPNPEPAVLERMIGVYRDNKYELKPLLSAMATSPEFWSDKCFRQVVKSPVAYTVAIGRQLDLGPPLTKAANANPSPTEPASGALRDIGSLVANMMHKQGLGLLYPPDVSGWRWGKSWITTAGMIERVRTGDYFFRQRQGLVMPNLLKQMNGRYAFKSSDDVVTAMAEWFDVPLSEEQRGVLSKVCDKNGGAKALAKANTAGAMFANMFRLVASIPEYQMS